MKNKFYLLLFFFLTTHLISAGNIISRDTKYYSGSTWKSPNGRFELLYKNGYLIENEITKYGKAQLFIFPDPNDKNRFPTKSGDPLIFETRYAHHSEVQTFPNDIYVISVGQVHWDFNGKKGMFDTKDLGFANQIKFYNYYIGRAGHIVLEDSGNFFITTEATEASHSKPIWNSKTTPDQLIASGKYPCILDQENYYFPRFSIKTIDTTYYSPKNMTFGYECKVIKNQASSTVTAKGFIEFKNDFDTDIKNSGVFIAKPLNPDAIIPSTVAKSSSNSKEPTKKELPINPISQFAVYPNPTTAKVNITLDTDDTIINILLFDLFGKKVGEFNNTLNFDISEFPKGVYLCKIESVNGIHTTRIIKQ